MRSDRIRRLQVDTQGTYHLTIPIQFVKSMELAKGQRLKIEQISKNKIEVSKIEEKL